MTATRITNLKKSGVYGDADGLRLRVTKTGKKNWIFRYRLFGKNKDMGLGSFPDISLSQARKKRDQQRELILQNIDPILENKKIKVDLIKKEAMTFKIAATSYIETFKDQWTNPKHAQQWTNTLVKYVFPHIGRYPVSQITNHDVLNLLKPFWSSKNETATRVRQRIEKILNWSITLGYRDHPNPAALNGNLEYLLPKSSAIRSVQHHRSLPYEKLPEFIEELNKVNLYSAKALMFLILTASRTNEVIGAEWDEFNLEYKIWNIPEHRIKIRNKHCVTLNQSAINLLNQLRQSSNSKYVFPGIKPNTHISNNSILSCLKNQFPEIYKQSVTHGFRSSFRDWAEEQHNFSRRAVELCLSHQNKNKTEEAYLRSKLLNKRHLIMNEWDKYLKGKAN